MAEGTTLTFHAINSLLMYSVCSSLLLIVNKITLKYVPVPSLVTLTQLISCSAFIFSLGYFNPNSVDALEWNKIKPYLVYVASFSAGIYTNMKALEGSNVDTVIVFRCCTPVAVSLCDYLFLGRELPNVRSSLALMLLMVGAIGYVQADSAFRLDGPSAYMWVSIYFVLLCFSMTYGKQISDQVPMRSTWGPALYSNFLSIPPTFAMGLMAGEQRMVSDVVWGSKAVWFLVLSCVLGVGISFTGWHARKAVSATLYTLVGVMNKMVTVAVNVAIWDDHASFIGILWLLVCIVAGSLYQQAPLRQQAPRVDRDSSLEAGKDGSAAGAGKSTG